MYKEISLELITHLKLTFVLKQHYMYHTSTAI